MKKFLAPLIAAALAVATMLPGEAAARLVGNHNRVLLALALVLLAVPSAAAAKIAGNHNRTRLHR
jgi:hypothetical protein